MVLPRRRTHRGLIRASLAFFVIACPAPTPATAAPCDRTDLLRHLVGGEFLHQRNPSRHVVSGDLVRAETLARRLGVDKPHLPRTKFAAWLATLERTHRPGRGEGAAQALKRFYRRRYVMRPEQVPASHFELQRRIARQQGHGDIAIDGALRDRLAQAVTQEQADSLDRWLDYFLSSDSDHLPMWAKVWSFEEMAKLKAREAGALEFSKRTATTTAAFPELNSEALAAVIEGVSRHLQKQPPDGLDPEFAELLRQGSFPKLYAWALRTRSSAIADLKVTAGQWRRFEKGSDPRALQESLQCGGTGWCTAGSVSTARDQLDAGDFHVYYTNDDQGMARQPRIAIRMDGNSIAEVRGIAAGQDLDRWIAQTDILETKLQEFGAEASKYKTRSLHMKRLTHIERLVQGDADLTPADLRFLYEIDEPIEGFGYAKDPRIAQLIAGRDQRADLARAFDVSPRQISLTQAEALQGGIVHHQGSLNLSDRTSTEGLILPKSVSGDLDLSGLASAKGLVLPRAASVSLRGLTSIEGLVLAPGKYKVIVDRLDPRETQILRGKFPDLQIIQLPRVVDTI